MRLRIPGYTDAPASSLRKIIRSRITKSLAHRLKPFGRVLVPYFDNRASRVLLEFLESARFPQYVALVARDEVPGRPTVIYERPLDLLLRGSKYAIYRPLDASEIAYMWLRFAGKNVVFYGLFPFRRVHPWELGAYLLHKGERFPRKQRPGEERRLVLDIEARYPRLSISAAAFVEKVSEALGKHVHSEPVELEPEERRLIGR